MCWFNMVNQNTKFWCKLILYMSFWSRWWRIYSKISKISKMADLWWTKIKFCWIWMKLVFPGIFRVADYESKVKIFKFKKSDLI